MQLSLGFDVAPEGFVYLPDFIGEDEERALLAAAAEVPLQQVVMHGTPAKRTVAHFGLTYAYDRSTELAPAAPLPPWVQPFVPRVAAAMKEPPAALAELLLTRYPPGARIGWHRDAPMFGPTVAGLSLGAAGELRFRRRRAGHGFDESAHPVAPRSLYVLGGAARAAWQHMIPPVDAERWSLTFRTLRPGARPSRAELRRHGESAD
jgi:alkylated DNA repair protein (DNA oxidative demethylase)